MDYRKSVIKTIGRIPFVCVQANKYKKGNTFSFGNQKNKTNSRKVGLEEGQAAGSWACKVELKAGSVPLEKVSAEEGND